MPLPLTRRPLVVEEPTGIHRACWPVTGGIPFARGEMADLGALRLLTSSGQEVPIQVWELCRWDDGSLRWVAAHAELTVERQSRLELSLEFGPGVQRVEPVPAVHLEERGDGLRLRTAALTLGVARRPLRLSGALADGPTLIEPQAGDGFWITDPAGRCYRAAVESVEVEIQGPLYALLRLHGKHVAQDGASLFDFTVRLHAFAHAPYVQLDYTFLNCQDELDTEVSEIAFQATLSPGARGTGLCGAYRALCEQAEGVVIHLGVPQHLTGIYPNGQVLRPTGEPLGVTAHGWADLSGPAGGVTLALRDYAENFPKRTVAADGRVQVHFWPAQAGPLRFHQGMAKTHRMMLYLHPDSGRQARASEMAHGFNERLVFAPQPWYLETMVCGEVFPYKPAQYPNMERRMRDEFIGWEDGNRALGMIDWGDFPQHGMEGRERFMANNEHDFMHVVLLQWMRTGERKLLRALDAAVYHTLDIDQVHHCNADPWQVGGVRTHADGHWSYGGRQYTSCSHMWAEGLAEYSCLFADRRAREGAEGICNVICGMVDRGARFLGGEREAGWACISLVPTYEVTGDGRYLRAARRIIHGSMGQQKADGSFDFPLGFADTYCPYLMTQYAAGLRHYLRVAQDEAVERCFLRLCDWLVEHSTFPDGAAMYWSHWDYRRSRSGGDMRGPLGYAWALTGDGRYLEHGMRDHERCFAGYASEMLNVWAWGINHVTDHVATLMGHTIAMHWQGNFRFCYWADKAGVLCDLRSV
ncbi:MAG: hypothetical protein AB1505_26890 [Candidatus Latescibacterota bacterium]